MRGCDFAGKDQLQPCVQRLGNLRGLGQARVFEDQNTALRFLALYGRVAWRRFSNGVRFALDKLLWWAKAIMVAKAAEA